MTALKDLSQEQRFCLRGCRSYGQYYRMREEFEIEHCPFCNINNEVNEIAWEDENIYAWFVPKEYLRDTLAHHVLYVPKRHIRFEAELTGDEQLSILAAKQYMPTRFDYSGGMTFVREGDMRHNAGTVPHLHYNTFVPNGTGEVRVPILKNVDALAENSHRAMSFAVRYERGETP